MKYAEMTVEDRSDVRAGIITMCVIAFFVSLFISWMYLLTISDNPDNFDQFVVVQPHRDGRDPSDDNYQIYSYGVWFKLFGPGYGSQIDNAWSGTSREEAVERLEAIIKDRQEEYTVLDTISREDFME